MPKRYSVHLNRAIADRNFKGPFYTLRHVRYRLKRDTGVLERGLGSVSGEGVDDRYVYDGRGRQVVASNARTGASSPRPLYLTECLLIGPKENAA